MIDFSVNTVFELKVLFHAPVGCIGFLPVHLANFSYSLRYVYLFITVVGLKVKKCAHTRRTFLKKHAPDAKNVHPVVGQARKIHLIIWSSEDDQD